MPGIIMNTKNFGMAGRDAIYRVRISRAINEMYA